jgi:hypothetical protein
MSGAISVRSSMYFTIVQPWYTVSVRSSCYDSTTMAQLCHRLRDFRLLLTKEFQTKSERKSSQGIMLLQVISLRQNELLKTLCSQ